MILVEVRSKKLHTAGEPHPAPSWDAAKVAFGKLCVDHNIPDSDEYALYGVADWSPETGTGIRRYLGPATSAECRDLYSPAPASEEEMKEVQL